MLHPKELSKVIAEDLAFHVNFLPSRQFTLKCQVIFSQKKKNAWSQTHTMQGLTIMEGHHG